MRTKEVPRTDWVHYFENFCNRYHRWPVSLEVFSPEIGAQTEVAHTPLEAIAADVKNSRSDCIAITVGSEFNHHITHIVREPIAVYEEISDAGTAAALEVVAIDGSKTLLRF
ncbi:MAG: DUF5335 family protein [Blastocatellia bacterium]|nr:DUF5335 family protein [Blastocatellia bacterium]